MPDFICPLTAPTLSGPTGLNRGEDAASGDDTSTLRNRRSPMRRKLAKKVSAIVSQLVDEGLLPASGLPVVEISDTKSPEHGDFACNFALAAAKASGRKPRELGTLLAEHLQADPIFEKVEVAGPGFVNMTLRSSAVGEEVQGALDMGIEGLARSEAERPLKLNVEFVSVNPNGPITVGSGRGAAFGDTLCRVLEAAGNQVWREYYINDGVNSEQMRMFAESVRCLATGRPLPEKAYRGDYVQDVADRLVARFPEAKTAVSAEGVSCVAPKRQKEVSQAAKTAGLPFIDLTTIEPDIEARKAVPANLVRRYRVFPMKVEKGAVWIAVPGAADPKAVAAINEAVNEDVRCAVAAPEEVEAFIDCFYSADHVGTLAWFQKMSQELMLERQREGLSCFGVEFDRWFSEQSLHDAGEVDRCLRELADKGVADREPVQYAWLPEGAKGRPKDEDEEEENGQAEPELAPESVVAQSRPPVSAKGVKYCLYAIPQATKNTLWLRSTRFGDDMDRVLRRSDGRLTYIASDVAYHDSKFDRPTDCDKLLTVLGPDHHGYVPRLKAVVQALGHSEDQLEAPIFQIVRFVKNGKPAPMRKRDGNIYALIDLIDELGKAMAPSAEQDEQRRIGRDVARFFYLMRSHDTHMDFDIDLATKQSDENPVFYVQYAHARICSVIEKAREAGFVVGAGKPDLSLLTHDKEKALVLKLLDLSHEVRRCAVDYGVHRLTTYAVELARTYHHFYDACRVIQTEEPELSKARLALCEAARVALCATFNLLGISAPERMERDNGE